MDKVRERSLVTVNEMIELDRYPFAGDLPLVFMGEIVNMPEHGIFIGKSGKCYCGFHIGIFRELTIDET